MSLNAVAPTVVATLIASCIMGLFFMWKEQGIQANRLATAEGKNTETAAQVAVLQGQVGDIRTGVAKIQGMLERREGATP